MKNKTLLLTILLALSGALAVPAIRADDNPPAEKKISKRILKKYDKDGDGKLNAEEEAAWKADQQKAKEKRAERKKAREGDAGSVQQ